MKLGFIGCGNMGEAILKGCLKTFGNKNIYIFEKNTSLSSKITKKYKVQSVKSTIDLIQHTNCIILAVKPQDFSLVLKEINTFRTSKKIIISIAAGITLSFIKSNLNQVKNCQIIRAMPNLAAKTKKSITAIAFSKKTSKSAINLAQIILSTIGKIVILPENKMDAITAISGSGPGYIYYFLKTLEDAACNLKFSKAQAHLLVKETALGAISLIETSNVSFEQLVNKVSSKKGTTEAALSELKNKGFNKIIYKAVNKAYKRAKQLSKTR